MDLETAKKLNEILKPYGYSVGRIYSEIRILQMEIYIMDSEASRTADDNLYDKKRQLQKEFDKIVRQ
jgi:hypothetical protein